MSRTGSEGDGTRSHQCRLVASGALLLWRYSMHSYDDSPRMDNWREILQVASQHDPDNAIYDYLAVHFYWVSSAETDFQGMNERLVVQDAERFNRGVSYFEEGQNKAFFAVGDAGFWLKTALSGRLA